MKITTVPKTLNQLENQLQAIEDLLDITQLASDKLGVNGDRHSREEGTLLEYLHAAQFALMNAKQIVGDACAQEFKKKTRERNDKYAHHRRAYYARTRAAAGKGPTACTMMVEAEIAARAAAKAE